MKKTKFYIAVLGLVAAALVSLSAEAQTFLEPTKTPYISTQFAQHTSTSTGAFKPVAETRSSMSIYASSTVGGVTGTLTLADKDGRVISTTTVTIPVTTTEILAVPAPLKFQQAKPTLNAPGNASVSDLRVFSRQ